MQLHSHFTAMELACGESFPNYIRNELFSKYMHTVFKTFNFQHDPVSLVAIILLILQLFYHQTQFVILLYEAYGKWNHINTNNNK